MVEASNFVTIRQETSDAYAAYLRESEVQQENVPFLWSDRCEQRTRQLNAGKTIIEAVPDKRVEIPHGMVHDWVGAVYLPGATLSQTVALLQDYDHHKTVYHPDVIDSKLLSQTGNHFDIYLRLLKKKVISIVIDTWHSVEYGTLDEGKSYCRSHTTRVCEIERPGQPNELARLPGTGHGFLWSMNSHWKLQQRNGGVVMECHSISLTRDIPSALKWIVGPMVQKLPTESLRATLEATRRALTPKAK